MKNSQAIQKAESIYTPQFALLCTSSFFFFVSFNMMIPELPAYLSSLGGADYKGLIIGLFTLSAGLSRPFSGKLADTIGRMPVIFFGVMMSFLCGLLYPVLNTVIGFLLLRFLHGFSTGFTPTGTSAYVADIVPATKRGEALGLLGLTSNIGTAIGPVLGGEIVLHYSVNMLFYCSAVFAIASMLMMILMKETLQSKRSFHPSLLRISRHEIIEPKVLLPFFLMFLGIFGFGAVLTLIPDFSEHLGIKNKGTFFGIYTISSLAIRVIAGRASDRYGRVLILKGAMIVMVAALVYIAYAKTGLDLMIGAIIYGVAVGMSAPTLFAWTIDLSDNANIGRAMATLYIALEAGIGTGALVSGWLYGNDIGMLPSIFLFAAFLTFLTLPVLYFGLDKSLPH